MILYTQSGEKSVDKCIGITCICGLSRLLQVANNVYGKENVGSSIVIKDNIIFNGGVSILAPLEEGHSVTVGNNCLFAGQISIRGCNEHTIYDLGSRKKLDIEESTVISDHVWVCEGNLILSGATIPADSVVAARSIVTKRFSEGHLLLAGVPAVIKKRNIGWERKYCQDDYVDY